MVSMQTGVTGSKPHSAANIFQQLRPVILEYWIESIREVYGEESSTREVPAGIGGGSDLLSIASEAMTSGKENLDTQTQSLLRRMRTRKYSISDFFKEWNSLHIALGRATADERVEQVGDFKEATHTLRKSLGDVCQSIIRATAEFYEHVIERCNTGFCQTDPMGRILFANDELQRMTGRSDLNGQPLVEMFASHDRKIIHSAFSGQPGSKPIFQQLQIRHRSGDVVPVGVELSTVCIEGETIGSYAHITDLTRPMELQHEIFDQFLLGIIQLDQEQRIIYTNKSIRTMLGIEDPYWKGKNFDILVHPEDLGIIEAQLHKRWEGESDDYEIRLLRQDDGRTVPVRISGSPEKDLQGNVIGTMGIIRSIVSERMHTYIESLKNGEELLSAVSELLRSAVPFDRLYVAVFSKDMRHVRNLFTYSPDGVPVLDKRWWEMTPDMLSWSTQENPVPVESVEEFYCREEFKHLREERTIQDIMDRFKTFIYYPIKKENHLAACIVIYSASEKPYTNEDCQEMARLPLEAAVLSALHFEENEHFMFLLNLLKEISSKGNHVKKTAAIIVGRIAEHFKWESVTLLRVDRMNRRIKLLSQTTLSEEFRIPDDYEQPIDEGVLGAVYRKKEPIVIGDVTRGEYKSIYRCTVAKTRSELCMPIESGDLFWLLNIEDSRTNAFSEDEKNALGLILDEIKIFLERTWLRSFLDKSLLSTSDAVLVVDEKGFVTLSNSAAQYMLEYTEDELDRKPIGNLLVDDKMADHLIHSQRVPNVRVKMNTKAGREISLLLSKFQLHEEFSSNIIIAKDLSLEDRVQELEYIGKLYYEIAIQTKTPLTLAFSWLRRAGAQSEDPKIQEMMAKTLQQLRKIELTFNRLAMYDQSKTEVPDVPYNEMLFDFDEIRDYLEGAFPTSEMERIRWSVSGDSHYLRGDPFLITFCFETILSYLLRFLPDEKCVEMEAVFGNDGLQVSIKGYFPGTPGESGDRSASLTMAQTLMDMALGEKIVESFIQMSGGLYTPHRVQNSHIKFQFMLKTPSKSPYR